MKRPLPSAIVGLWLLAAPPALAKPPLDYQDPPADPPASGQLARPSAGQLPGRIPDPLVGSGPFQRLPSYDDSRTIVVAVRDQPYWQAGRADPVLTNACRLGRFLTIPENTLVVRFTAPGGRGVLQLVPPDRRHLLFDAGRQARPGESYYFLDAGLPSCRVWVEGKGRPRSLDSRGTALPKADPQALAKRKALIDSWP